MHCEICGIDSEEITILPIPRGNGSLITLACTRCAIDSGKYCEQHTHSHLGFADGTSACLLCINKEVAELSPQLDQIVDRIERALPENQFQRLVHWANISSVLTETSLKVCIVRSVVTISQRTGNNIRHTVDEVVFTKKPDILLPPGF